MTPLVAFYVAAVVAGATCLEWPATVGTRNLNWYGKQQPAQKQNRFGSPAWPNTANRTGGSWAAPSLSAYGGNIMRHYPVSINRYQTMAGSGGRRSNALSDDYYDTDVASPYDPRPYDRMDYAVVRYPSYGNVGGYYGPVSADLASAYDVADEDDEVLYDDVAAASPLSPYYPGAVSAINRYPMPPPPPSNRYEPPRYPTDKIHKFWKVFLSNPVSPSNAFKSTKERQLYDFWESLINGDLDGMEQQSDGGGDVPQQTRRDWTQQQPARAESGTMSSAASQLYQHLPPIFQQLQQKQRQQQQQQQRQQLQSQKQPQIEVQQRQRLAEQRAPPSPSSTSLSSAASLSSSSSSSMSIPRGNLYKQWANGSPLIKRSSVVPPKTPSTSNDGDDVQQLEQLKANTTSTISTTIPAAVDEGQREYVLPRPAGEKSDLESLLEVIAEGGIRENAAENAAIAYKKLRQETKVNKKRSFVSDETSLAAQLGALRKN